MNVTSIIRLLPDSQEQAELFAEKLVEEMKLKHLTRDDLMTAQNFFTEAIGDAMVLYSNPSCRK